MNKLQILADLEGYDDVQAMLEDAVTDSVVKGICTNPGCENVEDVVPDSESGWCSECNTNSVKSCLVLAGII